MSTTDRFVRSSQEIVTKITVFDGRTGSGKSRVLKTNVLTSKGRHLLVVPRKQSISECKEDLLRARSKMILRTPIKAFLRDDDKRYNANIAQEITDYASRWRNSADHCCLIITQAAFQKLDPDDFTGWHLKLDELLTNGNISGSLFSPAMWQGLANLFSITPLTDYDRGLGRPDSFRRLVANDQVVLADVMADERLSAEDKNLFQRARSSIPVYIDAEEIEQVGQRRCRWCSPWTLDETDQFASVQIAACDIKQSLMHLLSPRAYQMIPIRPGVSRARIQLFYFDAGTLRCSARFWETETGKTNLTLIGYEIARRGGVDFWTCNESAAPILKPIMPRSSPNRTETDLNSLDGTWISQQQDGTNRFRECTSCAIFSSSKAQKHESIFEMLRA